ncbi:MAG: hypothetical protein ACFFCW_43040, partial [Candidatus Hodarchaeota archaeon]
MFFLFNRKPTSELLAIAVPSPSHILSLINYSQYLAVCYKILIEFNNLTIENQEVSPVTVQSQVKGMLS